MASIPDVKECFCSQLRGDGVGGGRKRGTAIVCVVSTFPLAWSSDVKECLCGELELRGDGVVGGRKGGNSLCSELRLRSHEIEKQYRKAAYF